MIEYNFLALLILPFIWVMLLGLIFFSRIRFTENFLSQSSKYISFALSLLAFTLFLQVWHLSPSSLSLNYGNWIEVGSFEFKIRFIADLLGGTYALLSTFLISTIFRYSRNYLHKEEGYFRFTFLLSVLQFGLMIVSFARSIDFLFMGWELVGTTSVLLINYFFSQVQPVRHSLKAIISYRLCDMGILAAAAWAHLHLMTTDFTEMPHVTKELSAQGGVGVLFIGIFIIWASLAKAGQLPMSSWLPTAMEGPTPSSAIFYGALSVHLGPFLLIRFHDYISFFPSLLWAIGIIGALTSLYATLVGRTRSDAKTMLGYATISQVGLMYIEIALGFTNFAMFHMFTHACLRTYQFLRSASLITDFVDNPNIVPDVFIRRSLSLENLFSSKIKRKIYIHALHAFHLDYITGRFLAAFCWPFKVYMTFEDKWMDWDNRLLKKIFGKG
jgi:NADH-quinone oxidoreductase subunit L